MVYNDGDFYHFKNIYNWTYKYTVQWAVPHKHLTKLQGKELEGVLFSFKGLIPADANITSYIHIFYI